MVRWIGIRFLAVPAIAASLITSTARAQPPRQQPQQISRARQACDAAAARNGYRVLRRDQENVNGSAYDLPLHVAHGTTEADVTCRYDAQRGSADLPTWDDRAGAVRGYGNRDRNRNRQLDQVQTLCQDYVTNRRYEVVQVGAAVRHGQNLYDVPVTVRRNNKNGRESTVTCRYNAASNKLSIR